MGLFETVGMWLLLLIAQWWAVVASPAPQLATTTATVVAVIDGDTIDVTMAGTKERVRYIGIDTPEPYAKGEPECGSHEASAENKRLVAGHTVELVADKEDKDKYGRLLRYVYVDGMMVNEELVKAGYAQPLTIAPNTKYKEVFAIAAADAAAAKRGNWDRCDIY